MVDSVLGGFDGGPIGEEVCCVDAVAGLVRNALGSRGQHPVALAHHEGKPVLHKSSLIHQASSNSKCGETSTPQDKAGEKVG